MNQKLGKRKRNLLGLIPVFAKNIREEATLPPKNEGSPNIYGIVIRGEGNSIKRNISYDGIYVEGKNNDIDSNIVARSRDEVSGNSGEDLRVGILNKSKGSTFSKINVSGYPTGIVDEGEDSKWSDVTVKKGSE